MPSTTTPVLMAPADEWITANLDDCINRCAPRCPRAVANPVLEAICVERGLVMAPKTKADMLQRIAGNLKDPTDYRWIARKLSKAKFNAALRVFGEKSILAVTPEFYDAVNEFWLVHTDPTSPEGFYDETDRMAHWELSDDEYKNLKAAGARRCRTSMAAGVLHEDTLGSFRGWRRLPTAHCTKLDVMSADEKWGIEVKNSTVSMNSDSGTTVVDKLVKWRDGAEGNVAILVQINCPDGSVRPPKGLPDNIKKWTGREAYKKLSGCDTFYDDLMVFIRVIMSEN